MSIPEELKKYPITPEESFPVNQSEKDETQEEKEFRQLESEYHRLSLVGLVLEQRLKIRQIRDALLALDQEKLKEEPIKEEPKVKRVPTDY